MKWGKKFDSPPVRHYIYVSDSKTSMIFDQIDARVKRRMSAELKIDLKVASLTLSGPDRRADTRASKLQIVERYLASTSSIGTIASPKTYFNGTLDMRWSWAGPGDRAVWFEGVHPRDRQCVGLGGSRYHVIGEVPESPWPSFTARPAVMDVLRRQGFLDSVELRESVLMGAIPDLRREVNLYWDRNYMRRSGLISSTQRLDFLAVRLADTTVSVDGEDVHVVVGSPIFVSMTP